MDQDYFVVTLVGSKSPNAPIFPIKKPNINESSAYSRLGSSRLTLQRWMETRYVDGDEAKSIDVDPGRQHIFI
jgi:hypothetical protein